MKCNSLGLLFCTILFPNHISGLFSQGQDMSLPGTKQQSGVDGGYPAESAVRCDKLMANPTRRCCQAGRGGSCSTRDSLSLLHTLMWHGNLFQASLRQCLRALISPERWSMDGGAETSCRRSPMDLSQQRGSAVNDCSRGRLSHHGRWKSMAATCGLKSKISARKAVLFTDILSAVCDCTCSDFFTLIKNMLFWLFCSYIPHNIRFFWYPCRPYPCALWLSSSSHSHSTETDCERCRHEFTELKSHPDARPLPLSLRHRHWNVFVWLLLKACTDLKTTSKIISNLPSPLLIQWMHDGKVAPSFTHPIKVFRKIKGVSGH